MAKMVMGLKAKPWGGGCNLNAPAKADEGWLIPRLLVWLVLSLVARSGC
jgi:hypothetical protein